VDQCRPGKYRNGPKVDDGIIESRWPLSRKIQSVNASQADAQGEDSHQLKEKLPGRATGIEAL
jgi:hypothetical protein